MFYNLHVKIRFDSILYFMNKIEYKRRQQQQPRYKIETFSDDLSQARWFSYERVLFVLAEAKRRDGISTMQSIRFYLFFNSLWIENGWAVSRLTDKLMSERMGLSVREGEKSRWCRWINFRAKEYLRNKR